MPQHTDAPTRRTFVGATAAAGMLAAFPALGGTLEPAQIPKIGLGPGGEVLDVPENREFLREAERGKPLTPEQLLKLATLYNDYPANRPLSEHLAAVAISTFVGSPAVNRAMERIAKTPVEWSILGDIFNAVKDFFTRTGGSGCVIKCILGCLVEKCPGKKYHVIGICIGGSF